MIWLINRGACDRPHYQVERKSTSYVITFSTSVFTQIYEDLLHYLQSSSQYSFQIIPEEDEQKNTPKDTIMVFEAGSQRKVFTINMYRTTCRMMVNGSQ